MPLRRYLAAIWLIKRMDGGLWGLGTIMPFSKHQCGARFLGILISISPGEDHCILTYNMKVGLEQPNGLALLNESLNCASILTASSRKEGVGRLADSDEQGSELDTGGQNLRFGDLFSVRKAPFYGCRTILLWLYFECYPHQICTCYGGLWQFTWTSGQKRESMAGKDLQLPKDAKQDQPYTAPADVWPVLNAIHWWKIPDDLFIRKILQMHLPCYSSNHRFFYNLQQPWGMCY